MYCSREVVHGLEPEVENGRFEAVNNRLGPDSHVTLNRNRYESIYSHCIQERWLHGEILSPRRRLAYLEDAAEELQRRIDLVMAGREEENTHEIALSGDLNELVEADDGIEVVNDDDVNSEDESDDDDDNDDRSV